MSYDPKEIWSPGAIKGMLRRQIAELAATVNPMLRGGANPDDNEDLRGQMMELESLRKMLKAEEEE